MPVIDVGKGGKGGNTSGMECVVWLSNTLTPVMSLPLVIMNQIYIDQLKDHIGESVTLKGWLYNKRSSGKLVFLQLRDGTDIVQCVVFKPNDEQLFELADSLGQ